MQPNNSFKGLVLVYFLSVFMKECNKDCKIHKSILKSMAVQIPFTPNPSMSLSANKIISALITKRNKPNVKIVTGNVKMTKIGFTKTLSTDITAATIKDVM